MTIGERLRRAILRSPYTQKQVADRAGMDESTLSDIVTGTSPRPSFESVERIVRALDTTFSELFDEPRLRLSFEDAALGRDFHAVLGRWLATDAALKAPTPAVSRIASPRPRSGSKALSTKARKAELLKHADVERLPDDPIPGPYQVQGARYAYRVRSEAMIEIGIFEDSTIYVRHTTHDDAADGQIVICKFDGALLLRRLDRTSGRISLHSENPHYDPILVDRKVDKFSLVGVVVRLEEE